MSDHLLLLFVIAGIYLAIAVIQLIQNLIIMEKNYKILEHQTSPIRE